VLVCRRSLGPGSSADLMLQTDGCSLSASAVVRSLEHVQVLVTLGASQRGRVQLSLTSPSGTRQILLARRRADTSSQGLNNWALMTVHCWGEDPRGNWTLTVSTASSSGTTCLSVCLWPLSVTVCIHVCSSCFYYSCCDWQQI